MINLEIKERQLKELRKACGLAKKTFGKELAAAINDTAKNHRLRQGRNIRGVVNLKKKEVESKITIRKATVVTPQARVFLLETAREGLQHFGARQTKSGVGYKISKKRGRGTVLGAFMGPSPGTFAPKLYGGVFRRVGKKRLPIMKLYGVSPYGAYAKNDFETTDVAYSGDYLQQQMDRRINLNVLRANGLIPK
jgi:hypothetical protein